MKAKFVNESLANDDKQANIDIDNYLERKKYSNKCPVCGGDGKRTITIDNRFNRPEPDDEYEIDCDFCDGTGKMNDKQMDIYNYEKNMWCDCGNPSEKVKFFDDDEHPEISKHHYRCKDCGKILQIG